MEGIVQPQQCSRRDVVHVPELIVHIVRTAQRETRHRYAEVITLRTVVARTDAQEAPRLTNIVTEGWIALVVKTAVVPLEVDEAPAHGKAQVLVLRDAYG